MRTALIGSVESSRAALETLIDGKTPPAAVFTLPLSKASRHSDFTDLRPLARKAGIPVHDAADVNGSVTLRRLKSLGLDHVFVIGWSQICGPAFLKIPRSGAIGFHPSALPDNRGRAVVPWTLLQRRVKAGGTLFWLDEGVDSGPILGQREIAIDPEETATTLYEKQLQCLRGLLKEALPRLAAGRAPRTPQDERRATYCARRTPEDGWIDWSLPAESVWTLIRATTRPYPGAFTLRDGGKMIIWEASWIREAPFTGLPGQVQSISPEGALIRCGDGGHVLARQVQLEGGTPARAEKVLKRHEQLGLTPWTLYTRTPNGQDRTGRRPPSR